MTDSSLLLQALGGEGDYLAQNPWAIAGSSIAKQDWGQPRSSSEAFLLPVLKGLSSGLLYGYGRKSAVEDALKDYSNTYQSMTGETYSPGEDWTIKRGQGDILKALRGEEIKNDLRKQMADLLKDQQLAQFKQQIETSDPVIEAAAKKAGMIKEAEQQAEASMGNPKQITDLEDKTYKRITDLPSFKQFTDIEANFKTLLAVKDNEEAAAAPAMITAFARIMDPTSTVREGEYNTISKSVQGYLDQVAGNWKNAFLGQTKLSKEARDAMALIASKKYNEFGNKYSSERGALLDALSTMGGNSARIPTPEYKPYEVPQMGAASPRLRASDLIAQGYIKTPQGWVR